MLVIELFLVQIWKHVCHYKLLFCAWTFSSLFPVFWSFKMASHSYYSLKYYFETWKYKKKILKTFSSFSLPHFCYMSQRRAVLVVLSHLNCRLQPTVYIEMLYLNSCEICTKIPGNDGNKVKFTLERFWETYIFGVYLSGSLRSTIATCWYVIAKEIWNW